MRFLATALTLTCAAAALAQVKQLEGVTGKMGAPVRLDQIQFTLTGAKFVHRIVAAKDTYVAPKGKKLLLLNFNVQNAVKNDIYYGVDTVGFTVVGANEENFKNERLVLNPDKLTVIGMQLKPAQKIPVVTFAIVPSDDPVPKLMVQSRQALARFDLRGKVTSGLDIFDGKDGVATDSAAAKVGQNLALGRFDLTVEKITTSTDSIKYVSPKGDTMWVAVFTVANPSAHEELFDSGHYKFALSDSNGETARFCTVASMSGAAPIITKVDSGKTMRVQAVFLAPPKFKPSSLEVKHSKSERLVTLPVQ